MTYNVRYFGHGTRGVFATRRGMRRVAASIARLSPLCDVVCLQEVEARSLRSAFATWCPGSKRPTQLQVLMTELDRAFRARGIEERYQAHYFPAHSYRLTRRTNLYTTGLAMLVRPRLKVVSHNAGYTQDITHRRGAKTMKQTRICAHISVQADGVGELDVFNTHMSLPGPFYPEFWLHESRLGFGPNQVIEARRLIEVIAHRRRSDSVVLVGDFNSLPGSPVDRLLRNHGGLVDALAQSKGLQVDDLVAWPTAGFRNMRMAIDRIYASPSIAWLDFEGTAPFDDSSFSGLSDHVPVVGRLRLAS